MTSTKPGINWPLDTSGEKRKTTATNKAIWCAAVGDAKKDLVAQINAEQNWRKKYQEYLQAIGELQFQSDETAIEMAKKGLDALYQRFTVVKVDEAGGIESEETIAEMLEKSRTSDPTDKIESVVVKGQVLLQDRPTPSLVELENVRKCVERKEMEADVVDTLKKMQTLAGDEPSMQTLRDSVCFVALGATSELCPLKNLLSWGFTVVGVSRPKVEQQEKLITFAKDSPGTLILPRKPGSKTTGADVITDFLAISDWLETLETDKQLVIGSYIYLDGAKNVQACLGMDVITSQLMKKRPNTGLSFLLSPGIVLPISKDAVNDGEKAFRSATYSDKVLGTFLGPFKQNKTKQIKNAKENTDTGDVYILNGIANFQGPSYALSKTLQVWRCIVALAEGKVVNCNLCPPSSTESVFHVRSAALALKGMKARFPPCTYYEPAFVRALMTQLALVDVHEQKTSTEQRTVVDNFLRNAVHGGCWRSPYDLESIGKAAVVYGFFQ